MGLCLVNRQHDEHSDTKLTHMKSIKYPLFGLSLVGALVQSSPAAPKEKPDAEVTARLTQVIKSAYPEVEIKGMAKETEDGLSFIGIEFTSKGVKMDADVTED